MFGWLFNKKSNEDMADRDIIDLNTDLGEKSTQSVAGNVSGNVLGEVSDSVSVAAPDHGEAGHDQSESAPQAETGGGSTIPQEELNSMTSDIIRMLKTVYDPEIPVDIYELGLIYKVDISDDRVLTVDMTLTAPGCPVAGEMPGWVEGAVRGVVGVEDVIVNMTFEPPWTTERMSDVAKLELGWM